MNQVASWVRRALDASRAIELMSPWIPPARVMTPTMASMNTTKRMIS